MTVAHVRYDSNRLNAAWLRTAGPRIARIIADSLTCSDPEGELTSDDVDVFFDESMSIDHTSRAVFIDIESRPFPSRVDYCEERRLRIEDGISKILPLGLRAGVWIKFVNATWGETVGIGSKATRRTPS